MSKDPELFARIPVHFASGRWLNEDGTPLTATDGTKAEFVIRKDELDCLYPVEAISLPAASQFLAPGARLRFALSIRQRDALTGAVLNHLILPQAMWRVVEWGPVRGWHSTDAHFFEVTLGPPTDEQKEQFPDFTGGLLVKAHGERVQEIQPSLFDLPSDVSDRKPRSLNHAYTILSEVYEVHRAAHTGNIFQRVFYEGDGNRWYPLEVLREVGIAMASGDPFISERLAQTFWMSDAWWDYT